MTGNIIHRKLPLILLIALGPIAGQMIPGFYDWTGSDQSRPSPLLLPIAVGILIVGTTVCASLPWIYPASHASRQHDRVQFGIRTLLAATALIGLFIAALRSPLANWVGAAALVIAIALVIGSCFKTQSIRLPMVALLTCMFGPYVWILTWKSISLGIGGTLLLSGGLPSFLPTLFIGRLLAQHSSELGWLSMALTGVILLAGLWLAKRGPRRFVAYSLFALITSLYGSFILNAIVRI